MGKAERAERRRSAVQLLPLLALLMLLSGALAGCGGSPQVAVGMGTVEAHGVARVSLDRVRGDILMFTVVNLSPGTLVVLRDRVVAETPYGISHRLPGGFSDLYNVAPYGAQRVNVRYDFRQLNLGDVALIHFRGAILVNGHPIEIAPIVVSKQ